MSQKYKVGTRFFYSFDDAIEGTPMMLRLTKLGKLDKDPMTFKDEKTGKLVRLTSDELFKDYTALRPDGYIIVGIVNVGDFKDILIALYRHQDASENKLPYAVCRNCVYDYFTNMIKKSDGITYVGISVSQDTYPAEAGDTFQNMLACDSINGTMQAIAVYLTDSLENIINLTHNRTKLNDVLRETYQKAKSVNPQCKGYEQTYSDLLEHNRFMYDFHKCFHVVDLPTIFITKGQEQLDYRQMLILENELKKNVIASYVVPYSRDIDLKDIKRSYVIAKCGDNKFYFIGYDTTNEDYIDRYAEEIKKIADESTLVNDQKPNT